MSDAFVFLTAAGLGLDNSDVAICRGDIAGDLAALLDRQVAMADRVRDPASLVDRQTLSGGWVALKAAVDFRFARTRAGRRSPTGWSACSKDWTNGLGKAEALVKTARR